MYANFTTNLGECTHKVTNEMISKKPLRQWRLKVTQSCHYLVSYKPQGQPHHQKILTLLVNEYLFLINRMLTLLTLFLLSMT